MAKEPTGPEPQHEKRVLQRSLLTVGTIYRRYYWDVVDGGWHYEDYCVTQAPYKRSDRWVLKARRFGDPAPTDQYLGDMGVATMLGFNGRSMAYVVIIEQH